MTMRQITDARAPFPDVDTALEVGAEHLRRLGWSPVGLVAEEQPGGYFVRIAGTVPASGSRARARHRQSVTAEVGKVEGPWLHPINDTWLSGKPYYCNACGLGGAEVMACEDGFCEIESAGEAQARLVKAHQEGKGMPQP